MRRVKDETGGCLCLRGVNVAGDAKHRPDRLPPYAEADFARLRDEIGASAIRLLVFWEAIEPVRGAYDESYLAAVRDRVDAAERAGLRVVVDMHQDLWGRGFGSAGAPDWAGDPEDHARFRGQRPWMLGYFRPEVTRAFDRLWHDDELQDAFARAWTRLVGAVHGSPAVVAYDLLNEPFWGSGHPDRFDRSIAPRFYARVIDAIRAIDPFRYVAIEPASIAGAGWRPRFVAPRRERLLFAPHLYPPAVEVGLGWPSAGAPEVIARHVATLERSARDANLPLLIGELGARREAPGATRFLEEVLDALDAAQLGWLYWDLGRADTGYALWNRDGTPSDHARAIARPGPIRIAGEPMRWHWDARARRFELEWTERDGVDGDTVVAVPSLALSRFEPALDDGGAVTVDQRRIRIPTQQRTRRRLIVRGAT